MAESRREALIEHAEQARVSRLLVTLDRNLKVVPDIAASRKPSMGGTEGIHQACSKAE